MLLATKALPTNFVRRPTQGNFNVFMRARQSDLNALIDQYAKGQISSREWADAFNEVLLNGHAQAWALGRQRAGDLRALNEIDMFRALAVVDADGYRLLGFMNDISTGRYTDVEGKIRADVVKQRASLYVGKMRGTATEAWAENGPDDQAINWIMLALEHCADCPMMAAKNPWQKGELWAFPGNGVQCLGNCKCVLRLENGSESFRHPSTPADAPDISLAA
jgi:hypothetical protein